MKNNEHEITTSDKEEKVNVCKNNDLLFFFKFHYFYNIFKG